ncbi:MULTISPECIES: MgtC/SapB family protein [Sphingobacterium]|jgi:putative Mg2+ transporter-C (MgtC) family protein|uniref:MgtC/SapB family protein n=1 Tax=Sphingobacterium TaxID=28453 RepID=UPI00038A16F6|nr:MULTISPECIES: MgtC/SapB family protein [Sphingobacterium]KKX49711.1 hypothetical protein L950_0214275 [Sphingobacterium sp. IITKGP-BTPF85]MCW2262964.1 putative Mg2+ transporter-C (MgtC) family protein [Sphingobacterium kitahiroshimense]NJI73909.1 MgtC/SapB family protein [Sphingobacterium sp. B16(2022)]QQD11596.1 MgtC/SapB family protein [Sphingobacterium sp. UDSM-2020]TCR12044.1 putative Mg2+ transporter-C (MgtC) family protein [Sphingobacterium sp. JUb78]
MNIQFLLIQTGYLDSVDFITRIAIAFALGLSIGAERQWRDKSAGLRTNALVSIGAAAYMLLSVYLYGADGGDPGRIAAQIVTGIGFLGAGVIMKDGLTIRGLNTAATIWCSAAVGTLCGMALYIEATIVTGAILFTHIAMGPFSDWLGALKSYKSRKVQEAFYLIKVTCKVEDETDIRSHIVGQIENRHTYLLRSVLRNVSVENANTVILNVKLSTVGKSDDKIEELIFELTKVKHVQEASWFYLGNSMEN